MASSDCDASTCPVCAIRSDDICSFRKMVLPDTMAALDGRVATLRGRIIADIVDDMTQALAENLAGIYETYAHQLDRLPDITATILEATEVTDAVVVAAHDLMPLVDDMCLRRCSFEVATEPAACCSPDQCGRRHGVATIHSAHCREEDACARCARRVFLAKAGPMSDGPLAEYEMAEATAFLTCPCCYALMDADALTETVGTDAATDILFEICVPYYYEAALQVRLRSGKEEEEEDDEYARAPKTTVLAEIHDSFIGLAQMLVELEDFGPSDARLLLNLVSFSRFSEEAARAIQGGEEPSAKRVCASA